MNKSSIFQKVLPHVVAIISFILISSIYFSPQLSGKVVQAGDTVSHKGMSKEMTDYFKKTGEHTLWTNAMFGGMPTYQIGAVRPTNTLGYVEKAMHLYIPRPIGYFVGMMIGFYVMMLLLGVNSWLSIIGAIAFSLTTDNVILFGAGHMSKLRTFVFFGFMFGGIVWAFRKKYLGGAILFAVGLGANLYANHIQMTYYLFIFLGIYGLIELVLHAKNGNLPSFAKAVLYLGIAGLVAIGSSASSLWTTYEYAKDTMRGEPILKKETNAQATSSNTKGLDVKYAMQYSNGWLDLVSSFIPGVVGGGGGERIGKNSAYAKDIRKRGGQAPSRAPLYWGAVGKRSTTAGPIYFGAAMFFLFFLGMLVVRGAVKWGLVGGVALTMLLSLGDNFWGFNQLFFDYFPMYNKFRTPNSILAITSFLVPILGTLAVSEIMKGSISKKELLKSLYISTGVMGGICLFFALLGGSFFDFTYPLRDNYYAENYNMNIGALKIDRAALMRSDALRSLGIILVAAALLWAFLTEKIKKNILLIGLAVIVIGDLWTVDKRYLGADKFVSKTKYEAYKNPRPVDNEILKDRALDYRVHDLTIDPFNSSSTSYFHKTIGGYHPAKLQRYQDLIDRYIGKDDQALRRALSKQNGVNEANQILQNSSVFNMLNTKYIIVNPKGAPLPNPNAMGNAWFVNKVQVVENANEEIAQLQGLDVGATAIVHKEFQNYVKGLNLSKNGSIKLVSYEPNHLTYESNSSSEQLAVFSEIWYGPDKGWQAYIDDQPVEHIRVNYVLRALKIPAGKHKVEFKFAPRSYSLGLKITLVFSLLILGAFLWLIWQSVAPYLRGDKNETTHLQEKPKKSKTPKLKKTRPKKKK